MFPTKTFCRFQFKNDMLINQNICIIIAYFTTLEIYFYMLLWFAKETTPTKFLKERILIYSFQKPKS